ncbi:MAG TPA: hypothetical protein VF733_02090 [Candidatus Saccharimonadales bacterium]
MSSEHPVESDRLQSIGMSGQTEMQPRWDDYQANLPDTSGSLHLPTDQNFPIEERFPRKLVIEVKDRPDPLGRLIMGRDGHPFPVRLAQIFLREAEPNAFPDGPIANYRGTGSTQGFALGQWGDELNEAARVDDGYRFHDPFHMSLMTMTGYSAVARSLLRLKRRSNPDYDFSDDGPRAIATEEAVFNSLGMHRAFPGGILMPNLDLFAEAYESQRDLSKVMSGDVKIPLSDWKKAIKIGVRLLTLLDGTIGGRRAPHIPPIPEVKSAWMAFDLDRKEVRFSLDGFEAVKNARPMDPDDKLFLQDGRLYGMDDPATQHASG